MIDVEKSSHKELLDEYERCEKEWGRYSSDCFGFYVQALHRKIVELGGWPS